jgi:hypothetical protein
MNIKTRGTTENESEEEKMFIANVRHKSLSFMRNTFKLNCNFGNDLSLCLLRPNLKLKRVCQYLQGI